MKKRAIDSSKIINWIDDLFKIYPRRLLKLSISNYYWIKIKPTLLILSEIVKDKTANEILDDAEAFTQVTQFV
jgi:serine O-acetyltransferase